MLASYTLDPYGDDWERTSRGTAETINAIQALAAGFAGENAPEITPLPGDFMVPYREHKDPEEEDLEAGLEALEGTRWQG